MILALNGKKNVKIPAKVLMYRMIKEHGAQSVLGRALKPQEAIEMQIVNRIEQAHYERKNAQNDAAWANNDPGGFRLIMWAERLANE